MDPYIGQIMMFGGDFTIQGWAKCDGQLLSIAQNTALFSILGTTYGGDGRVTFALPDLRGRVPVHMGQGPGLTYRTEGEVGGVETVTLHTSEMPAHNHSLNVHGGTGDQPSPVNNFLSGEATGATAVYSAGPATNIANPMSIGLTGNNLPHDNMQPYLVINFLIALVGIFPPRG